MFRFLSVSIMAPTLALGVGACEVSSEDGLDAARALHNMDTSCSGNIGLDCDDCCIDLGYDDGTTISGVCGCRYESYDTVACASATASSDACSTCCADGDFNGQSYEQGANVSCTCILWSKTP